MQLALSKEEVDEILIELKTGNITATEIAARYGFTLDWLKDKIRKFYPDHNMKYNRVNHNYFDEIGPHQAYIVGLILTDGCVTISERIKKRNGENQWVISLQERDKYILENIRLKIGQISHVLTMKTKNHIATQFMCSLRVCSNKHVEKLGEFGIYPRKSLKVGVSDFFLKNNDDLFWHLLRGIFDGNGSFVTNKTYGGNFSICGSYDTCFALAKKLKEDFDIGNGRVFFHRGVYIFRISAYKDILKLFRFMYKDKDNLFLKRKYEKFQHGVATIALSKKFRSSTNQLGDEPFHLQKEVLPNETAPQ